MVMFIIVYEIVCVGALLCLYVCVCMYASMFQSILQIVSMVTLYISFALTSL